MGTPRLDQGLTRKGGWNMLAVGLVMAQAVVVSVAAARLLGQEAFAELVYVNTVVQVAAALALLALPTIVMRYLPEALGRGDGPGARRALDGLSLAALGGLALAGALLLASARLGDVLLLAGFTGLAVALALAQGLSQLGSHAVQAVGRFDLVARTNLVVAPATVIATLVVLAAGGGVRGVLLVTIGAALLTALLWNRRARLELGPGSPATPPPWRAMGRFGLLISGLVVVDLVVWQRSELFFLRRWSTSGELALYGVAFQLVAGLVRMAPFAAGAVLMPAFAYLEGQRDPAARARLYAEGTRVMALATAPLLVLAAAGAPALLGLWGPEYVSAWPLVGLLAVGVGAGNVSVVAAALLQGAERAGVVLKAGVVLAVVNIALDVALIPGHGALGAAVACSGAQLLTLPVLFVWSRRALGVRAPWTSLRRLMLPTAGAAALGMGVARLFGSPFVAGAVGGLAGLVALMAGLRLLGVWTDADQTRLERALRHLPGGQRLASAVTGRVGLAPLEATPAAEPASPAVTLVVPTRNRPDFLPECLSRIEAEPGPEREVIVVDSSDDERCWRLLEDFPNVRGLRIPGGRDNRHAAKNAGLARARGRVVSFLDDDSMVEPGWLDRILAHFEDPAVGGVGGRIIDQSFGPPVEGEAVGSLEPNGRLTLNFTRHTGQVVAVNHFIGCNQSWRRQALAEVGGFDTCYGGPNFMEETDLCVRVERAGYRLLFDPDAVVHHLNAPRDTGMKREALDPRVEFWTARSRAYFALKLLARNWRVFRYVGPAFLAQHARAAWTGHGTAHLRALGLQGLGLALGACDWLAAGRPRVPPPPEKGR